MTVGEIIRNNRKQQNLTQKQLGSLCEPKIGESTIRKYELGLLNPKIETLRKIATALHMDLQEFLVDKYIAYDTETKELRVFDDNSTPASNYENSEEENAIYIDTEGMENHPYNILLEKIKNDEKLTEEEGTYLINYTKEALISSVDSLKKFGERLNNHYELLNEKGQKKADAELNRALENIEMITQIPEYRLKEAADKVRKQSTSLPSVLDAIKNANLKENELVVLEKQNPLKKGEK